MSHCITVFLWSEYHSLVELERDSHGIKVDYTTMMEDDFRNAVETVLFNKSYSENVKRYSVLYKDRPLTARQSVVYWSEYVIRHRGAAHLKSPLVYMTWYEAANLDVMAFILLVIILIVWILKVFWEITFKLVKKISVKDKLVLWCCL